MPATPADYVNARLSAVSSLAKPSRISSRLITSDGAMRTTSGPATRTSNPDSPAAVITDPDTHYKHLLLNCTPHVAILDPNLVAKMPAPITAATGMDALTHAIEAYVNPGNTPFTRMFATRAIQQISMNLRQAVNGPDRPAALKNMLYAADIAGQSMAQGLGQVHGLSHVVSGRLGTPHGVANAILLSQVLEFHNEFLADQLHEIAPLMYEAAGQSVAWVKEVEPVARIMDRLVRQTRQSLECLRPYLPD